MSKETTPAQPTAYDTLAAEATTLRTKLSDAEARATTAEKKATDAEAKVTQLTNDLTTARASVTSLTKERDDAQARVKELEAQAKTADQKAQEALARVGVPAEQAPAGGPKQGNANPEKAPVSEDKLHTNWNSQVSKLLPGRKT